MGREGRGPLRQPESQIRRIAPATGVDIQTVGFSPVLSWPGRQKQRAMATFDEREQAFEKIAAPACDWAPFAQLRILRPDIQGSIYT